MIKYTLEAECKELIKWFEEKHPEYKIKIDFFCNTDLDKQREEYLVEIWKEGVEFHKASCTYITETMQVDPIYLESLRMAFVPRSIRAIEDSIKHYTKVIT